MIRNGQAPSDYIKRCLLHTTVNIRISNFGYSINGHCLNEYLMNKLIINGFNKDFSFIQGITMTGSSSTSAAASNASTNPYIAFRRRTEKMQTRKNRKNDETSYEKMLKLRRDLSRAIILLVISTI